MLSGGVLLSGSSARGFIAESFISQTPHTILSVIVLECDDSGETEAQNDQTPRRQSPVSKGHTVACVLLVSGTFMDLDRQKTECR